jgi:hypothetical protein
MSIKTKNTKTTTDKLNEAAMQGGIVLMAAAATLGMLELPDQQNSKVIVPNQPAFAMAVQGGDDPNNTLRREREETTPHFISYSVVQRTAGRTGKR